MELLALDNGFELNHARWYSKFYDPDIHGDFTACHYSNYIFTEKTLLEDLSDGSCVAVLSSEMDSVENMMLILSPVQELVGKTFSCKLKFKPACETKLKVELAGVLKQQDANSLLSLCSSLNYTLPIARNESEFNNTFYKFDGQKNPILWATSYFSQDKLMWCKLPGVLVPVKVDGDLKEPFVLVSFPKQQPNLNALHLPSMNLNFSQIFCLVKSEFFH
ncbi:Hypothetical predicted protein [Cloeon dipterum]|uniref:Uncharacterized protein n=1 Tax=Cloeon dipterum TaxID=197152 RepID=A0A8S1DW86_9INSE|nr:Hypothetical predicted protein [Cloeon dipterum]